MTSTDLAVTTTRQTVQLSTEQLRYIANTEMVPTGKRGNLPMILACVAYGREIGIGDMVALNEVDIIEGKAAPSAELMVLLARQRGHSLTWSYNGAEACTVKGKRADNGDEGEITWTLQMADRAGLLKKQNWTKYPEAMLWARSASQLCRMLFPDIFAGSTYTSEELGVEDMPEPEPAYEDGDDVEPETNLTGDPGLDQEPDVNQLEIVDA